MPPICVLCARAAETGRDLCLACEQELPYITTSCRQCAIPMPQNGICGQCQQHSPAFDSAHALFHYAEPVDYLVQQLKFNNKLYLARLLAQLMLQREQQKLPTPDVVIPVPLHRARLRQRGFNQALELARPIAKAMALPLMPGLCRRQQPTPAQTGLDAEARRRNLKNAFVVDDLGDYRHPLIVDDVMTTASTAEMMAKALKKAGAESVDVWVFARASLDKT